MNLPNDNEDSHSNNDTANINTNTNTNTNTNNANLSSSPPTTPPPSADPVDAARLEDNATSSSPDQRSDIDERPVVIAQEYLPTITALVESLAPRRVKVYELRGEVWVDLGTGFCQGYVENVSALKIDWLTQLAEHSVPKGYQRGSSYDRVIELRNHGSNRLRQTARYKILFPPRSAKRLRNVNSLDHKADHRHGPEFPGRTRMFRNHVSRPKSNV